MRRPGVLLSLLIPLLMGGMFLNHQPASADQGGIPHVSGEVIIKWKVHASQAEKDQVKAELRATKRKAYGRIRAELHEMLIPKIQNVSEIKNGYAIDFPACSGTLVQVAEMVAMSRECCEFLDYSIVADSNGGAVRLVMTGDAGGKAFLAEALGPMVTEVADADGGDV